MRYSKIAMIVLLAGSGLTLSFSALAELRPLKPEDVVDLSGTVSMSHKQYWQGGGRHHQPIIVPYITHGPGPHAADLLIVDENTGPQLDCPPHMMPPLGNGLPNSGYWGTLTCDKVPIWQFLGETVRIDGRSFAPGDVVLYWSRYVDNYDLPGEAGRRLHIELLEGKAPAFPTPNWEAQDYLGAKGVLAVALDSPSIGSFGEPDYVMRGPASINQTPRGLETHLALFKYGGIDVEGLQNFDKVPNGSLFINLAVNHVGSPTAETRAVAIVAKDLAKALLPAVKAHKVCRSVRSPADGQPRFVDRRRHRQLCFPLLHGRQRRLVQRPDRPLLGQHALAGQPRRNAHHAAGGLFSPARFRCGEIRCQDERMAKGIRGEIRPGRAIRNDLRESAAALSDGAGARHRRAQPGRFDPILRMAEIPRNHRRSGSVP